MGLDGCVMEMDGNGMDKCCIWTWDWMDRGRIGYGNWMGMEYMNY